VPVVVVVVFVVVLNIHIGKAVWDSGAVITESDT